MTTNQKLSECLGVNPQQLKKLNVLNAIIGIDSKMRDALLKRKEDCPEIIVIDGVIKPSASRR